MQREVGTFPLPQHVVFKLQASGFTTVEDLQNIGPAELAKEADLTQEEALEALELVLRSDEDASSERNTVSSMSALDILMEEKSKPPIPTFCQALDNILGGGVPMKKVTEVCGPPGSGKTQLCLQLCANVQIPAECGGVNGEAVYIDTEGSFIVDRLVQIVDSTVDTCIKIMKHSDPPVCIESFCTNSILERIYYFHCKSYTELIARLHLLPEFMKEHPKVSLLIIDSISFHFRYGFDESYFLRTRLLSGISQSLVRIANDFKLAVLVTNQMTTKVQEGDGTLVPALGESWGHACTIRVILSWEDGKRQAYLFKSPWKEEAKANYQITAGGIRDCPSASVKREKNETSSHEAQHASKKAKISS